jgi:rhodanese-related sulfurtransferase
MRGGGRKSRRCYTPGAETVAPGRPMKIRDLGFKQRFILLGVGATVGFAVVFIIVARIVERVMVNGEIYQGVVQEKDLVADLLPPTLYMIEPFLLCHRIAGEEDEAMDELPFSISVEELARRRDEEAAPVVLDVRLVEELRIVSLPGSVLHIPLHTLPDRISELDSSLEYAVLCHHGVRSGQAVKYLRAHGYGGARDVEGGIDRWSLVVDPGLSRY